MEQSNIRYFIAMRESNLNKNNNKICMSDYLSLYYFLMLSEITKYCGKVISIINEEWG